MRIVEKMRISKEEPFMKRALRIAFVAFWICTCFGAVAFAKEYRWNANSVWPPNNHLSIGLEEFSKKIAEKTDGQLDLVVQSGGALGFKGPELLKAVRDGLLPVSDMLISGVAGDEPVLGVVTLPFLVHSFEEGETLAKIARPYFNQILEKKWRQKILYLAPWPAAGLWSQKEVLSVADMKGLKTRTYDKNGALVMEAVGATPYPLPLSEVYSSLATGLIDSVLTSSPTGVDGKFWEVLKYFSRFNITMAQDMVTVNLQQFEKLDPELQKALLETGEEMEKIMWARVAELDKEKERICNENGIISSPVSESFMAELTEYTEEIRAEWYEDAPEEAKAIYDEFLEAVGRKK